MKISEMQHDLFNQTIKTHVFEGDLSVTEYENGTVIVYNDSETPAVWHGKTVAPRDVMRFDH